VGARKVCEQGEFSKGLTRAEIRGHHKGSIGAKNADLDSAGHDNGDAWLPVTATVNELPVLITDHGTGLHQQIPDRIRQ
jgi:hypothetical protein